MRLAPALPDLPMTTLQRRLWKLAAGWGLMVAILVGAGIFSAEDQSKSGLAFGGDFIAFYSAGTLVNQDRTADLYDLDALRVFQYNLKTENDLPDSTAKLAPWWNPPFVALAFAPLATLRYGTALGVWEAINAACLVVALALIVHNYLGGLCLRNWKTWGLFVLFVTLSSPAYQTFSHGQNTGVTLLLTTLAVVCWTRGLALPAGLVAGLLFYKPQHAAIFSAVMVLALGWRALLGVTMTGLTLVLANLAALPGTLGAWLTSLPGNLKRVQEDVPYVWDRQVTFKAFWRLLLQGTDVGPTSWVVTMLFVSCTLVLGAALALTAWRAWSCGATKGMIGPVLVCSPLLVPFCFDYDLLVLSVAAGLYVADRLECVRLTRVNVWTGRTWVAVFVWTIVNPGLAGRIEFNGTTVLLVALACLELSRAWHRAGEVRTTGFGDTELRLPQTVRMTAWSEAA